MPGSTNAQRDELKQQANDLLSKVTHDKDQATDRKTRRSFRALLKAVESLIEGVTSDTSSSLDVANAFLQCLIDKEKLYRNPSYDSTLYELANQSDARFFQLVLSKNNEHENNKESMSASSSNNPS